MRGSSDSDKAVGVLLPFAAGYYLSYLFRSINALIAGDLVAELGLGAADLDLLTSAYFLVFAAVVLPCGVLQSMLLRPKHMDLGNKVARADLTKNGDPRIYHLTAELVAELRTLEPRVARERNGTPKTLEDGSPDLRVFGYSDRKGPLAPWKETCKSAGMPYLSPREAGRHGFGTETIVRQKLDPVTAAKLGHWSDPTVLLKTCAHAEGLGEIPEATFGKKYTGRGTKIGIRSGAAPENHERTKGSVDSARPSVGRALPPVG